MMTVQKVSFVQAKPTLVLGLPTGRTPVRLYHELVSLVAHNQLDLSQIRTFNLDEFLGVGREHPGSYRRFMEEHLFKPAGIADHQVESPSLDPCEGFLAIGGLLDDVTGVPETLGDDGPERRLVLDDENDGADDGFGIFGASSDSRIHAFWRRSQTERLISSASVSAMRRHSAA